MCGICGIAIPSQLNRPVDEIALTRMRDVITHRGPDDAGTYINGNIGLGHRRLSIVDVSGGHQPMTNEDGTIHIVFNGEIYNHVPLRRALQAAGHHYANNSDTETIVHLYEERGPEAIQALSGMLPPTAVGSLGLKFTAPYRRSEPLSSFFVQRPYESAVDPLPTFCPHLVTIAIS